MKTTLLIKSLVFVLIFIFNSGSAQTFYFQDIPDENYQVNYRMILPTSGYKSYEYKTTSLFTGLYDLSCNIPVATHSNLVLSVPLSYESVKYNNTYNFIYGDGSHHELGFGNIFLGYQKWWLKKPTGKGVFTVGLNLPIASVKKSGALDLGLEYNSYELQKYLPGYFTLYLNLASHKKSNNLIFGIEGGPNLIYSPEDELFLLHLHYVIKVGYQAGPVAITTELPGTVLTSFGNDWGGFFLIKQTAAIGAQWMKGNIRPGIFYRRDVLYSFDITVANPALGFTLNASINKVKKTNQESF